MALDSDAGGRVPSEYDVAVVGGGPAGCSAAVFTARYGLDTVVFDRGNSALRRCAYLANYLGFPGGIEVDTFYDLMHAHAEAAGSDIVPELVDSVERSDAGRRFAVDTEDGSSVLADHVVTATWYDGDYLRPLDDEAMFELHEHHGEREERFDPEYPDADGRTPIDGLYVASPNGTRNAQAIVSAGQGAHVARSLIKDVRAEVGFPDAVATHYDWLRPASEFTGEWADRDRWREWFDNQIDDEHEDLDELREAYIDRAFRTRQSDAEVEERRQRGYERLLDHIDDEVIREYLDRTTE